MCRINKDGQSWRIEGRRWMLRVVLVYWPWLMRGIHQWNQHRENSSPAVEAAPSAPVNLHKTRFVFPLHEAAELLRHSGSFFSLLFPSVRLDVQKVGRVIVWWLWNVTDELYPSTHQRLEEMPLKDPLSFKRPRTWTACVIFKTYPVTKDTSTPHLDYMWTGVSSWMGGNVSLSCPQASLCPTPTCFLMGWGADQSHLSSCCWETGRVVAKHRATTFTSWTIFLKVRIWKIMLPHRSAEAGPWNTCSFSVKYHRLGLRARTISPSDANSQLRGWSPPNPDKSAV